MNLLGMNITKQENKNSEYVRRAAKQTRKITSTKQFRYEIGILKIRSILLAMIQKCVTNLNRRLESISNKNSQKRPRSSESE